MTDTLAQRARKLAKDVQGCDFCGTRQGQFKDLLLALADENERLQFRYESGIETTKLAVEEARRCQKELAEARAAVHAEVANLKRVVDELIEIKAERDALQERLAAQQVRCDDLQAHYDAAVEVATDLAWAAAPTNQMSDCHAEALRRIESKLAERKKRAE